MKLRICGMQIRGGRAEDKVEVVSVGKMYEEEGAVCVSYEEMSDANEMGIVHVVNNLLKVQDNQVEVIKKRGFGKSYGFCAGAGDLHILFHADRGAGSEYFYKTNRA